MVGYSVGLITNSLKQQSTGRRVVALGHALNNPQSTTIEFVLVVWWLPASLRVRCIVDSSSDMVKTYVFAVSHLELTIYINDAVSILNYV